MSLSLSRSLSLFLSCLVFGSRLRDLSGPAGVFHRGDDVASNAARRALTRRGIAGHRRDELMHTLSHAAPLSVGAILILFSWLRGNVQFQVVHILGLEPRRTRRSWRHQRAMPPLTDSSARSISRPEAASTPTPTPTRRHLGPARGGGGGGGGSIVRPITGVRTGSRPIAISRPSLERHR